MISNGYQLVTSLTGAPKPLADQTLINLQGNLLGRSANRGEEYALPTVIVVAHYDAAAASPGLAAGADANGSGVTALLELARVWQMLYRSKKTQPAYNMVFLLSGGGKINYLGSRKFIADISDDDETISAAGVDKEGADPSSFEIMKNQVRFVLCLDGLGLGESLNAHVSKPPKEGTPANKFLSDLRKVASVVSPDTKVEMVHKKINLAHETLAWEHEQFSIGKMTAMTLSR